MGGGLRSLGGPRRGLLATRAPVAFFALALVLLPGPAQAACPDGVPVSAPAVINGLLDGALASDLSAEELAQVEAGRLVVKKRCVPGYANPRYRIYRAVRATPMTVAAVSSDAVRFSDRLPGTFGVQAVDLDADDPARERAPDSVHAVRMRYFVVAPLVVEDYTLRFVAGPYLQPAAPLPPRFLMSEHNAFAFKWTRLASNLAKVLDGSARFEPLDEERSLMRYDTFVAFGGAADARYRPNPPGVEGAIRQVVNRIARQAERAQMLLDADPDSLRGWKRTLRTWLDGLVAEMDGNPALHAGFPADDRELLAWPLDPP